MARHRMRARREAGDLGPAETPAPAPRALGRAAPNASPPNDPGLAASLERAVEALDRLAQDSAYTDDEQQAFVRQAVALRRRAAQLDAAQFDAATAGYGEAVAALGAVHRAVGAAQGRIDQLPEFFGLVTRVAGVLDSLLTAVA